MDKNKERVKPGAVVLDAGAGSVERTLATLEPSQPGVVITLDAPSSSADSGTILTSRTFDDTKSERPLPLSLSGFGVQHSCEKESEGMLMMWGYGFGWGWLMMSFGTVLWIALVAVLVWAVIRWLGRKTITPIAPSPGTPLVGPSALCTWRDRYGDI